MRMLWASLRQRLFLSYVLIVGLTLAAVGILIYHQTQSFFVTNRAKQAREVVYWAVSQSEPLGQLRADNVESVAERLLISPSPDFSFFLFDNGGTFVKELGQGSQSLTEVPLSSSSVASAVKKGSEAKFIMPTAGRRYQTLVCIFPVFNSAGSLQGVIQVQARLDEANLALDKLRWLLVSGLGGVFLLACILWFFFIRATFRPLEQMARISRAVAAGDLSQRMHLSPGRDELHETDQTFNRMLDSIEEYVAKEKQNQERLKRFFADLTHELRSPLTVLKGYTDVLLRGSKDDRSALEGSLVAMRITTGRLIKLTNDLLTLNRLDAGTGLSLEDVDVSLLCEPACQTAKVIAEGREVICQSGPAVIVRGDVELLGRVMSNLLDNAIQHTHSGGRISVTVASSKDQCHITVQDDGEGIPPEDLPHVFDRFYRGRQRRPGSTGLGLAIAKATIEAHGGQIAIESTVGSGTTVTIVLPLVAEP